MRYFFLDPHFNRLLCCRGSVNRSEYRTSLTSQTPGSTSRNPAKTGRGRRAIGQSDSRRHLSRASFGTLRTSLPYRTARTTVFERAIRTYRATVSAPFHLGSNREISNCWETHTRPPCGSATTTVFISFTLASCRRAALGHFEHCSRLFYGYAPRSRIKRGACDFTLLAPRTIHARHQGPSCRWQESLALRTL